MKQNQRREASGHHQPTDTKPTDTTEAPKPDTAGALADLAGVDTGEDFTPPIKDAPIASPAAPKKFDPELAGAVTAGTNLVMGAMMEWRGPHWSPVVEIPDTDKNGKPTTTTHDNAAAFGEAVAVYVHKKWGDTELPPEMALIMAAGSLLAGPVTVELMQIKERREQAAKRNHEGGENGTQPGHQPAES